MYSVRRHLVLNLKKKETKHDCKSKLPFILCIFFVISSSSSFAAAAATAADISYQAFSLSLYYFFL